MTTEEFINDFSNNEPFIKVMTSGSTGMPKEMLVEKSRMLSSARMTCDFLNLKQGDSALLCMSLDYIAGKMMVVRALERNMRLIEVAPCGNPFSKIDVAPDFTAIVPMQLYNTMKDPHQRQILSQTRHVIVGGGAVDESIEKELKSFSNAIWSSYGMTETLSHIALRRISGNEASEWYTPMPGIALSQDEEGCLIIDAPALNPEVLHTNDIVQMREDGSFKVLGRRDNVICSGGIKIQIEQLERQLSHHLPHPFMITKAKDPKFGEVVVLLTEGPIAESTEACRNNLERYHQPKHIFHIDKIPLTETGKPARAQAITLVEELMSRQSLIPQQIFP